MFGYMVVIKEVQQGLHFENDRVRAEVVKLDVEVNVASTVSCFEMPM